MPRRPNSAPYRRHLRGLGAAVAAASAVLTPSQIQAYAANAGFSGPDLTTAVAIALAESSGKSGAYNPEGSYGLWQIYLPAHPEFAGQNLYDPQTNANAAFSVYRDAGGFSPWSTYKSGKYQAFVSAAPMTIDAATGQVVDDASNVDALQSVQASLFGATPQQLLLLTVAGIGVYVLRDLLSD